MFTRACAHHMSAISPYTISDFGQYLYFKILFKSVCALLLLLGANLQVKFGAGKIFGQRAEN